MKWRLFQRRYPHVASVLPEDFLENAESDNELRRAIARERIEFLEMIESLVVKAPAQEIVEGSYQNSLYTKDSFSGFYSELRGFLLAEQFCNPEPADIAGGEGLPDLTCNNLGRRGVDFEVSRFSSWDKMIDVQEAAVDKFNGTPYTPIVNYLDPFFVMPYGYREIRANEIFVADIMDKLQQVNANNPPPVIQNHGIEIEIRRTGASRGMMGTTSVRAFPLDPDGAVSHRLNKKAEKQRGYRSLVIILDSELSFLDYRDLRQLTLGTSVTSIGGTNPAPQIVRSSRLWQSYMQNNGVLKIPEDEVGLFAQDGLSRVAGVILIDKSDVCYFIPNCYSNDLEFKEIYHQVENAIHGLDLSKLI